MAASDPGSGPVPTDEALARAADDEVAAAEARAEAARARADELHRRIAAADAAAPARPGTRLLPAVGLGAAGVVAALLLALTGYQLWQHKAMAQQRHSAAEFAAAARQNVVNLMSIDYNSADDSVQRVLDGSTGRFKTNFEETADDFVKALRDEKIVTKASVNDTAVESMSGDSAVVLVSATSQREGPQAPKDQQQPRLWRIVVSLERDGDQIKMSGVEFV